MTNKRNSILSALFSLGAVFALTACIDPIIIGNNGGGGGGNGGSAGMGGNPGACMTDTDCGMGQSCMNGMCANGDPTTCNGVPSPLSCTQTGCAPGEICVMDPDPNACYPSSCGCDPATGMWVCTADCGPGGICMQQMCTPSPEVCNAVDDDCDGVIDEQDDPAIPLCANGAVCVMGQCGGNFMCMTDADCPPNTLCQNGICGGATCTQEACNGIDDDCNGVIDDGSGAICADGTICTNGQCGGSPMQCSPNIPCPPGQVCSPNGVCIPGGNCVPAQETCNGIDDDCDNAIDEVTPGATLCPNGGVCVNGQCGGSPMQCSPNIPCPPGQVCSPNGVCIPGGNCVPKPETCNNVDDDCDGAIDEVTPGATLCPNGGVCTMGTCLLIQCQNNAQCPVGTLCVNGLCK